MSSRGGARKVLALLVPALLGALALTVAGLVAQRAGEGEMREVARSLVPAGFTVTDIHHRSPSRILGRDEAVQLRAQSPAVYRPGAVDFGSASASHGWTNSDREQRDNGEALTVYTGAVVGYILVADTGSGTELAIDAHRESPGLDLLWWPAGGAVGGLILATGWSRVKARRAA